MSQLPAIALVTFSVITFVSAFGDTFDEAYFKSLLEEVKRGNVISDDTVAEIYKQIDGESEFGELAKQFDDELEATYSSTGRFGHESQHLSELIKTKLVDSFLTRISQGAGGNGVNGKCIFVKLLLQNVKNVECVAFPGPNGTHPLGEGYFKPGEPPKAGERLTPTAQAFEDLQNVINGNPNLATKVKANTHYLLGKEYMDTLFREYDHGKLEDRNGTLKHAVSLLKGIQRPDGHADPLEINVEDMPYWNAARVVMEHQLNQIEKKEPSVKIESVVGVSYSNVLEIIPYLANSNMKKSYNGRKPKKFAIDNVMGITKEGEPKKYWNLEIERAPTLDPSYEADEVFQCYRKKSTVNYKNKFNNAVKINVPNGSAFCKPIEDILRSNQNHNYAPNYGNSSNTYEDDDSYPPWQR